MPQESGREWWDSLIFQSNPQHELNLKKLRETQRNGCVSRET